MSDNRVIVDVGAWGWSHPEWQDRFYPDDLPADWRFQYYTSKYRTVVFTCAEALKILQQDTAQYLEAMDDQFEFFVEISSAMFTQPEMQLSEWLDRWQVFGKHLKGFVAADIPPQARMAEKLSLFGKTAVNLHVLCWPQDQDVSLLYKNNNICVAATMGTIEKVNNVCLAVVDQDAVGNNLEKLADFIQGFIARKSDAPVVYLYIRGAPPSAMLMEQSETILSLVLPNE